MRNHPTGELEGRISRIVGGGPVALAGFVDPLGDVGGAQARHRRHTAEGVVEDVAPVAEHIENDAAALFRPIVPGWALRRLQVPLKYPVAELAAHREQATEEPRIDHLLE